MIVNIREYDEDPSASNDEHVAGSRNQKERTAINFRYEYTVDITTTTSPPNSSTPDNIMHHRRGQPQEFQDRSIVRIGIIWDRCSKVFVDLFLPLGYPHSVDTSYLPYQLYDGLQGLCSYLRGVVATRAVLEAAGVGNAQATAASAAMQWAFRDGTGMVGGLLFSYIASRYFDTHVKEFRLFADVINDVALTLDMLAPYAGPGWSLHVLSLSTIGKTLCGMSAGATKGRITQHFSRHGNMADLSAKESTQETLVSLLGMIGGVAVAHLLQHMSYSFTWIIFGVLTIIHVWANYKAVTLLKLATLNPERTYAILDDIIRVLTNNGTAEELKASLQTLPSPEEVTESLASSTIKLLFPTVHLSTPLDKEKLHFAEHFIDEKYLIGRSGTGSHFYVYLAVGASYEDELQAYTHALLLQAVSRTNEIDEIVVRRTLAQCSALFGKENICLWNRLRHLGWDLQSRMYLGFDSRRYQWNPITEFNNTKDQKSQ